MTALVATLVARPGDDSGLRSALDAAVAVAPAPTVDWLSEGEAVDVAFASGDPGIRESLLAIAAGRAVDIIVQPTARRRKMLLVADMDSTMIAQECIDELAEVVGFRREVADLTERAMRGEIAFEPALRERAALLDGLRVETIARVLAERITPTPGARTLVATMRAHGATAILVSGGFTDFAEPVGTTIGFDEVRVNRLVAENGRLTGKVTDPILGPDAKRAALESEAARLAIDLADTLAVGDGANDVPMVKAAGLGVAYRPKPALAAVADARLDHTDLTTLLFAQGYRREAFVG